MNSIAPIWDGNETWLILGSVGLFAIFPVAFAIIIPAVYFPILLMLLALIFRGLAFEFRYRDAGSSFDCFTRFSIFTGLALMSAVVVVSLWTPFIDAHIAARCPGRTSRCSRRCRS